MPELPEVEILRRGLAPRLVGRRVQRVVVRQPKLRWRVPPHIGARLAGQTIEDVGRRAKYLLLRTSGGTVILHLGMSGSLRLVDADRRPETHDHVDLVLSGGETLRLHDPRRFGAVLWTRHPPERHRLIRDLGPEPLGAAFDGDHLRRAADGRRAPVKGLIMNGRVVVGIGNIYANEALFRAGVHPFRRSGRISAERYRILAEAIRTVLNRAIARGGTTLRDFASESGEPGRFGPELLVYGKAGEPCPRCGSALRQRALAGRSTFFCRRCQR